MATKRNSAITRRKRGTRIPVQDEKVAQAWTNLKSNSSLSSLTAFAKSRKTPENLRELEKSLSRIEAFSRTRPLRRRFPRPAYILHSPNFAFCTDLVEMENKNSNKGTHYVLVLLDMFSKKCALEPLKKKNKELTKLAIEKAMKRLTDNYAKVPHYVLSDGGLEFANSAVRGYFKKHGIEHRVLITNQKAAICEIFNKSLQNFIYKYLTLKNTKTWLPALPLYEERYNNTKHHTTKYAPVDVSEENSGEIFRNMYKKIIETPRKPPRYQVNDTVRIGEKQNIFSKKYKPMFSKTIYKIIKVKDTYPTYSFLLSTLDNKELNRSFVAEELSPATI